MKVRELYNIIKESLKETLKEQNAIKSTDLKPSAIDKFGNAVSPALSTGGCPTTTNYGIISLYSSADSECNSPYEVNDSFICCSGNNPEPDDTPLQVLFSIPNQFGTVDVVGNQGQCYCPTGVMGDCLGNGSTQFTFEDLNSYHTNMMGGFDLTLYSVGTAEMLCEDTIAGCPHPLSEPLPDGTPTYQPTYIGCVDDSGVVVEGNIDCCVFSGCGSLTSVPPANNIDIIPPTQGFPAIEGNDNQPYWYDNGSCLWDLQCTESTVVLTINGIDQTFSTNNYVGSVNNALPIYNDVNLSGGICNIEVCTDEALAELIDPLGNPVGTTYIAPEGEYGAYNLIQYGDACELTVCNTPGYDNYYNPEDTNNWAFGINPGYTIIADNSLCQNSTVPGCIDPLACNYNENADTDDGSCIYPQEGFDCDGNIIPILGCTNSLDNAVPFSNYNPEANTDDGSCVFYYCLDQGALNFVCTDYPELCLGDIGAPTIYNINLGTFNNFGCQYPSPGCMDDTATNFDPNADIPCNSENNTCQPYNILLPVGPDNPIQSGENCCCVYSPGCTNPMAVNFNPSALIDDGSCIDAKPGCTNPGFDNYDPTANINDGSCVYEGCMMTVASDTGQATDSPWNAYVCLVDEEVTDETFGSPTFGETYTVGEWLCACGGLSLSGEVECSGASDIQTVLGTFIDPGVFDSSIPQDEYTMGADITDSNLGLCKDEGIIDGLDGCNNAGSPTYFINTGVETIETEVTNYQQFVNDDGSCLYVGCNNPFALNYFCVDNPGLCTTNVENFASGCLTDLELYPSELATCLDATYGTLNTPTDFGDEDGCVYPQTFDCPFPTGGGNNASEGPAQCIENFTGTGEYSTLQECELLCRWCSEVEATRCNTKPTKTSGLKDYDPLSKPAKSDDIVNIECLEIDGLTGNPDPSVDMPGTYSIGSVFKMGTPGAINVAGEQATNYQHFVVQNIYNTPAQGLINSYESSVCPPPPGVRPERPLDPSGELGPPGDDVMGGDDTITPGGTSGWFCPADAGNFPWPSCCIQTGVDYSVGLFTYPGPAFQEFADGYESQVAQNGPEGITYFSTVPGNITSYNSQEQCNNQSSCSDNISLNGSSCGTGILPPPPPPPEEDDEEVTPWGACELCPPGPPWEIVNVNNNPPYPNVPYPANTAYPGPPTGGYYCPISLQPDCCRYYRFDNPGDGNSYYHPSVVPYIDYCNNYYGYEANPPNNIAFGN